MVTGQEDHVVDTETIAKIANQNPDIFWYVGSVYTQNASGLTAAHSEVVDWCSVLVKSGVVSFYSPIIHWHDLSIYSGMDPKDHDLWMKIDEDMMSRCGGMIYCMMDNHQKSKGLAHEVKFFQKAGKPILYWQSPF